MKLIVPGLANGHQAEPHAEAAADPMATARPTTPRAVATKRSRLAHQRMGFGEGGCWYWFLPEHWADYEALLATGISIEKALTQVIKYPALPNMSNLKVAK